MTKDITVSSGGKAPPTQEDLQEKLMMFQLMERQLESLRQQAGLIEQRMMEIETSRHALKEIGKLKPGNEAMIPLGSGVYTKASIKGSGILTDLGAGIMKEKSVKEADSFLKSRMKDLETVQGQIERDMKGLAEKLQELAPELQKMAEQIQGKS